MIKRLSLLIAAALMAVLMVVATAAPAFADPPNASGKVDGGKKIGALSNNPNDGNGPVRR